MPSVTEKKHLRVETPVTIDGTNLKYAEDGKTVVTRITFLPPSARKSLEAVEAKYPAHLRSKITEVEGLKPQQQSKKKEKTPAE